MYIVIVGGGNVGYYLGKQLLDTGKHEVLLLEKNRAIHRTIAEELGEMAMQGDGCEIRQLEEAGLERADVVVAVTGDDEDNLVICQMAKMHFRVPRTIARVNNPRNEELFRRLGIDATVSATKIIYNLLEQEIETDEVIPLAALRRGNLEIIDIEIGPKSPVLNRSVGELNLPPEGLIVSIIRSDHGILPTPTMQFMEGDSVLALVDQEREPDMRRIFSGEVD
jgi:trk system potassium uptake protein TrkA